MSKSAPKILRTIDHPVPFYELTSCKSCKWTAPQPASSVGWIRHSSAPAAEPAIQAEIDGKRQGFKQPRTAGEAPARPWPGLPRSGLKQQHQSPPIHANDSPARWPQRSPVGHHRQTKDPICTCPVTDLRSCRKPAQHPNRITKTARFKLPHRGGGTRKPWSGLHRRLKRLLQHLG